MSCVDNAGDGSSVASRRSPSLVRFGCGTEISGSKNKISAHSTLLVYLFIIPSTSSGSSMLIIDTLFLM